MNNKISQKKELKLTKTECMERVSDFFSKAKKKGIKCIDNLSHSTFAGVAEGFGYTQGPFLAGFGLVGGAVMSIASVISGHFEYLIPAWTVYGGFTLSGIAAIGTARTNKLIADATDVYYGRCFIVDFYGRRYRRKSVFYYRRYRKNVKNKRKHDRLHKKYLTNEENCVLTPAQKMLEISRGCEK